MDNKGQGTGIDLIMTVIIGLLLFFYVSAVFNSKVNEAIEGQKINLMKEKAFIIGEKLVSGKGYPETWVNDINSTKIIGLAEKSNELSGLKVNALTRLDYDITKNLFGLNNYDLSIRILDINSNNIIDYGVHVTNAARAVEIERFAMMNGQIVRVKVNVWE